MARPEIHGPNRRNPSKSSNNSSSSNENHRNSASTLSTSTPFTLRNRSGATSLATPPTTLRVEHHSFAPAPVAQEMSTVYVQQHHGFRTTSSNTPTSQASTANGHASAAQKTPSPPKRTSMFFSLFGSSHHNTAMDPSKVLSTPKAVTISTPMTLAMTPDEFDDDLSPSKQSQYLETSSTEAASSGKSALESEAGDVDHLLSGTFLSSGRALFKPPNDDYFSDDSETLETTAMSSSPSPTRSSLSNDPPANYLPSNHSVDATPKEYHHNDTICLETLRSPFSRNRTVSCSNATSSQNGTTRSHLPNPETLAHTGTTKSKVRIQLRSRRSSWSSATVLGPRNSSTVGQSDEDDNDCNATMGDTECAYDEKDDSVYYCATSNGTNHLNHGGSAANASPFRAKRRRRRNGARLAADSKKQRLSCASLLLQRLLTTKYIVWMLCLVGLTSVSMIVTTNHRLSQADIERRRQNQEVAVLFHRVSTRQLSPTSSRQHSRRSRHADETRGTKLTAPPPPMSATNSNLLLRSAAHHNLKDPSSHRPPTPHQDTSTAAHVSKSRRTVNLNTLSQLRDVDVVPHSGSKSLPKAAGSSHETNRDVHSHSRQKEKHRGSHQEEDETKEHRHRRRRRRQEQNRQHRHEEEEQEERHHHRSHHHDAGDTRIYERAAAGIVNFSQIPQVAMPPPAEFDDVNTEASFEPLDRFMYKQSMATPHKRVVRLGGTEADDSLPPPHRLVELYPSDFTDNTQLYSVLDSGDERVATIELREPYVQGECVPMQKWQTTFNPSCNGMHELDMSAMGDNRSEDDYKLFGMNGFWRNAWRYDSIGGHGMVADRDTVVLKTLKINHRFEDAYFENSRIDAVVLERLTASPHVINVFGFCGHSVITEYADGKRLGELADKMKKVPLARLQIARDIANGLADVHGIDGDGNATFVHLDINPANVVSIGGTLKLNDFNIGVLRRWNTTSNKPCGIPTQYPNPQWRSPEEARREQNLTEKVDVFSLGHIFFRLICGHEPWHKLEPDGMPSKETLNEKVKQGILPTFPDDVLHSSDPEIIAVRNAMMRCYTYDPVDRPSARDIALYLDNALRKLELQAEVE